MSLQSILEESRSYLSKIAKTPRIGPPPGPKPRRIGPPGPKPSIFGDNVYWNEEEHRWRARPEPQSLEKPDKTQSTNEEKLVSGQEPGYNSLSDAPERLEVSREAIINDIRNNFEVHQFDDQLREFAKYMWGDQSSKVVSGEEFDSLPGILIFRGISSRDHIKANLDGSTFGKGVNGNGQYYSSYFGEAQGYGNINKGGMIYTAKINPDAKIFDFFDFITNHFDEDLPYSDSIDLISNGFDILNYSDRYIVLNQRAVVVDERILPGGDFDNKILEEKQAKERRHKEKEDIDKQIDLTRMHIVDIMRDARQKKLKFNEITKLIQPFNDQIEELRNRSMDLRFTMSDIEDLYRKFYSFSDI